MKNLFKSLLLGLSVLLLVACGGDDSNESDSPITFTDITEVFVGNISASNIQLYTDFDLDTFIDENPMIGDTFYISTAIDSTQTSSAAETYTLKLYIDNTLVKTSSWSSGFSAHWLSEIDTNSYSAGTHTIKIIVDEENNLSETNEEDNEVSTTITFDEYVAPTINLVHNNFTDSSDNDLGSSILLTDDNTYATFLSGNPQDGDSVYVKAQFECTSTATSPESTGDFKINIYLNDSIYNTISVDDIPNSTTKLITFEIPNSDLKAYPYSNTIKIVLDTENDIRETSETDNETEYTFSIDRPIRNLNVLGIKVYKNYDTSTSLGSDEITTITKTSDKIYIIPTVTSTFNTYISVLSKLTIERNGTSYASGEVRYYGYPRAFNFSPEKVGTYTFKYSVDTNSELIETDEDDNSYSISFLVTD